MPDIKTILTRDGRPDPKVIEALRADAQARGLAKRTIILEMDLMTGNYQCRATAMDPVTHLGLLCFALVQLAGQILGLRPSKLVGAAGAPMPPTQDPAAVAPEAPAGAATGQPAETPAGDAGEAGQDQATGAAPQA